MPHLRRLITEIHRRSLWQVLGIYAVASWIIYQVVLALYDGLGLPDWVPGTALVLLLVGLPIVLATAFIQEGSPVFRGDLPRQGIEGLETTAVVPGPEAPSGDRRGAEAAPAAEKRTARLFTWPRAIVGGVLAFALLGVAASGFMGMRALGIGPAATLVSSGALEARSEVVLADFGNATRDSLLGEVVTEALRIDLRQSAAIRLVDPAHVGAALERMRRADEPLSTDVALEMAEREGFAAVVAGEVGAVGSAFVLSARVLAGQDGRELLALRETASDADDLLEAIDRMSARLREQAGESLREIRGSPGLEQVSTSSMAALRAYSRGWQLLRQGGGQPAAADLFREAIRQDSTFAMAHRSLGAVLSNMGIRRREEITARTRAYEFRDRLGDRERLYAEGTYHYGVTGEHERARRAFEELVERFPEEADGHNYLGLIATDREERVGHFQRAASIRFRDVYYNNLLGSLAPLGWYDSASVVAESYLRQAPDLGVAIGTPAWLAMHALELDRADSLAAELEASSHEEVRGLAGWVRTRVAAARGQIAEVERRSGLSGAVAGIRRDVLGDTAGALRIHRELLARERIDTLDVLDRPYIAISRLLAQSGRPDEARRFLDAYEDSVPADNRGLDLTVVHRARAELALARGDLPAARAEIAAAERRSACESCTAEQMVRWYEAAAMPDSAMVQREILVALPGGRGLTDFGALGHHLYILGDHFDQRGDRERALRYYGSLAELWKDADPALQPRVEAARRALARLTSEAGR